MYNKVYKKSLLNNKCDDTIYVKYIKRLFDLFISLFGIIILSPIYFIISISIFINDPGPIFFSQKRIGKNKTIFNLHKFRSMKMSTPKNVPTHMLKEPEKYITEVGHFIRHYSLDELPQLWDIFIGNMSLIGPRPALFNQYDLIEERDKYGANDIKPGLTGWAQINGRDELPIPIKAKYDGEYVRNISFLFDFKCIIKTFVVVLTHKGVKEGGTRGE